MPIKKRDTPEDMEQVIAVLIDTIRPFAKVADAQQHSDCGGLKQKDWERAAEIVAVYDVC